MAFLKFSKKVLYFSNLLQRIFKTSLSLCRSVNSFLSKTALNFQFSTAPRGRHRKIRALSKKRICSQCSALSIDKIRKKTCGQFLKNNFLKISEISKSCNYGIFKNLAKFFYIPIIYSKRSIK